VEEQESRNKVNKQYNKKEDNQREKEIRKTENTRK
jgi:hypothetical protein